MTRFLLSLMLLAPVAELSALVFKGRVLVDGQPVEHASVGIIETKMAVLTNKKGEFEIKPVKAGRYKVQVVHPRAKTRIFPVHIKRDFTIDLDLRGHAFEARALQLPHSPLMPTSYTRDYNRIVSRVPGVLGFSPNYFSSLPSSSKGSVLIEAPIFRSQDPRLNTYEVDGLTLDTPFHVLGLFNAINVRHVESVEVFRGVHPVTSRDQQGAAFIRYSLPANYRGTQKASLELGSIQGNGRLQYQVSDLASGSFMARRTHVDRTFDSELDLYLFDYQGKNVFNFSPRHRVEMVYLGVDNPIKTQDDDFDIGGTLDLEAHAQKIEYEYFSKRNQILSLAVKNRYAANNIEFDDITYRDSSSIFIINPKFVYEYEQFKVAEVGLSTFFEKREAVLETNSSLFTLPTYPAGTTTPSSLSYDSGDATSFGGYLRIFGHRGLLAWDFSGRMDSYNELELPVSSGAGMVYLIFLPYWKWYVGGGLYNRRVAPSRHVGFSEVKALEPEEVIKSETGLKWQATDDVAFTLSGFRYKWRNLVALDPFVADETEESGLYQNKDEVESQGVEFSWLWELNWFYWRLGYTYQHMPPGSPFYIYYRRHILNTSVMLLGDISVSLNMKVWSNLGTIDNDTEGLLSPLAQIDVRWEHKVLSYVTYYIEAGQLLNAYLLSDFSKAGSPTEKTDDAFFSNTLFGSSSSSGPTEDVSFHLAFGVQRTIE